MRRGFSAVILLLIVSVLWGGALLGSPAGAAPQLMKVRYGLPTSPPVITTAGAFFALEQGFVRQEDLDVEIIPYRGPLRKLTPPFLVRT